MVLLQTVSSVVYNSLCCPSKWTKASIAHQREMNTYALFSSQENDIMEVAGCCEVWWMPHRLLQSLREMMIDFQNQSFDSMGTYEEEAWLLASSSCISNFVMEFNKAENKQGHLEEIPLSLSESWFHCGSHSGGKDIVWEHNGWNEQSHVYFRTRFVH